MNLDAATNVAAADPVAAAAAQAQAACDPACLERTCQSLQQFDLATSDELNQLRSHGTAPLSGPRPWDPLEFVAALRVRDPDARPAEVERLGRGLAAAAGQLLALVPFVSRMPTPSAFYDDHQDLLMRSQELLVPVVFSEESEVIGIASINPVALDLAEHFIIEEVSKRTGNIPLISKLLLHHEGWVSICQKQFGL